MIYTELTKKAMIIAYNAHHGQLDKGGMPYILHPVHLAEQMQDEYSVCAALLHDVAEDTALTLDELAKYFPQEIISALRLLTHDDSVPYLDYIRKVKNNRIAASVKLADLRHNSDITRLNGKPSNYDIIRLKKYAEAISILTKNE